MSDLRLSRTYSESEGTFGVLQWTGRPPFAVSLEDPWKDNLPNESCIPFGRYWCAPVESPIFGETFEVTGVKNRSLIRFHWGNTHRDTKGCILVAETFTEINGIEGVGFSKKGFEEFLSTAPPTGFWLNIHWTMQ